MNLYRILKNGILSRKEMEGEMKSSSIGSPIVSLKREEEVFESSSITPLTDGEVLDTNDPLTIAKYKNNLELLIQKVKEEKEIRDFRLIREDDFFPYDWKWRVNSKDTCREFAKSNLAYELRMAEARKKISKSSIYPVDVPFLDDEEKKIASNFDKHFGQVYEPVRFRSTKHFTINTPLSYTGSYNQVSSNRNFIVIDTSDLFCNSHYGYSADYFDAYLDMTHEELPISSSAIVLIEENRYQELIKDPSILKDLEKRKVVLYRGDETTAINMVLSEEGVLPYLMGRYREFDPELDEIMVQSMKKFCQENHLDYAQSHGNLFGRGGHFSDRLDSENKERDEFLVEFSTFLQQIYPEYAGLFTTSFFHYPDRIIGAIGSDKVLNGVLQYNEWAKKEEKESLKRYDLEREKVTEEVHDLFTQTIHLIREYYRQKEEGFILEDEELHQAILTFFHSSIVDEQITASKKIQEVLKKQNKKL